MAVDALQLLAANGLVLVAGLGVLRLVGAPLRSGPAVVGVAYLAGLAAVGVSAQLLLLVGADLLRWQVILLCGALAGAGLVAGREEPEPTAVPGTGARVVAVAGGALVLAALLLLFVDLWYQPLFAWDAWQHWTAKARSFVLVGGLDASLFSSPAYLAWNADYPVLLPALEAVDFRFMGVNTQTLHLQFGLIVAGFITSVAYLARPAVPPALLWPVLAMLAWSPSLLIQTASAYADVPLAAFFGAAGLCAWRWLRYGLRSDLALLGIFSAAALATKMEGVIYVGALLLVVVGLALRRGRREAIATASAGAAAIAVGIVPWRVWTLVHDVEAAYSSREFLERLADPAAVSATRLVVAPARLGFELLDPRSWLLVVPVAAVAAALAFRRGAGRDAAVFGLATVTLILGGLTLVYCLTPFPFEWHLDRSAWRVVTGVAAFVGALTPVLLSEAVRRTP